MMRAGAGEEECCISALYEMSRGSLRFRGLARAAGAEAVLARVAAAEGGGGGEEGDGEEDAEGDEGGRRRHGRAGGGIGRVRRLRRHLRVGRAGGAPPKILLHRRRRSRQMAEEAPSEFLCPISGALMADPVIVPTGESFERSCVHACLDLAFTPPSLSHALDLSTSASASPSSSPTSPSGTRSSAGATAPGSLAPLPSPPTRLSTSSEASCRGGELRAHAEGEFPRRCWRSRGSAGSGSP
uniref:U-box domain-containing protein n=1 Tax=Ananas comosus var. bracteatus TaxID=296719 RepID=A0A6V7P7Z2_ANACO|nr:unnamed protein product [Ananas comosus var. bracteatus]